MKDEKERIKELEKQVKGLESALAQSHVKNIALESLLECAEEHYQADFKKNTEILFLLSPVFPHRFWSPVNKE